MFVHASACSRLRYAYNAMKHLLSTAPRSLRLALVAALAGLVRLHSKLAEASGRLRLAGVNPHLYELLEVTHLHKLLDVRGPRGAGRRVRRKRRLHHPSFLLLR